MNIKQWIQLLRLAWHFLHHRVHHLIPASLLPNPALRFILGCFKLLLPPGRRNLEQNLVLALELRGPVFIKLGQLLSTRPDIVGAQLSKALTRLQDQVQPIADEDAVARLHMLLGAEQSKDFTHIDAQPLASASIAQVHQGQLADGRAVVLKMVRPNLQQEIDSDMFMLRAVAQWITARVRFAQQLRLPKLLADYHQVLLGELDMYREANHQIQLRRNFADSNLLYVPRVYGQYTRRDLLVMEQVFAPRINDMATLTEAGVDFAVLARKGVETFFTQVFEHNFFHADMHPGNIFVDISDPADPRYIALDCAIIGSLEQSDQRYLGQNVLAFFARDYAEIAALHVRSGWVPITTDAAEFEQVIRDLCEPIFAKPLSEISFSLFMTDLLDTARKFDMTVQPQLALLQKTLLYVEGLGRELYPQLDLWDTALPFMRRWAAKNFGPAAVAEQVIAYAPQILSQLHRLPELLDEKPVNALRQSLAVQEQQLRDLEHVLEKSRTATKNGQRLMVVGIIVVAALLLLD